MKKVKIIMIIVMVVGSIPPSWLFKQEQQIVELNYEVQKLPISPLNNLQPTRDIVEEEVIFSNFRDGVLGTSITREDMQVNDMGWLTYNDKVIVATATSHLIKSPRYELKDGFHQFDYYDTLYIHYEGNTYKAIVLDSCGTCTLGKDNEEYQRVDILVANDIQKFLTTGRITYIMKEER